MIVGCIDNHVCRLLDVDNMFDVYNGINIKLQIAVQAVGEGTGHGQDEK